MIQGVSGPASFPPLLCGEDGAHRASGLGITYSPPRTPWGTGLSPTVSLAARVGEGAGGERKVETAADHLMLSPNDTKSC